jgi:hypothetical protein
VILDGQATIAVFKLNQNAQKIVEEMEYVKLIIPVYVNIS